MPFAELPIQEETISVSQLQQLQLLSNDIFLLLGSLSDLPYVEEMKQARKWIANNIAACFESVNRVACKRFLLAAKKSCDQLVFLFKVTKKVYKNAEWMSNLEQATMYTEILAKWISLLKNSA